MLPQSAEKKAVPLKGSPKDRPYDIKTPTSSSSQKRSFFNDPIVHLLRNSMDFVSWKDRKGLASALKQIYRATDANAAEKALAAFDAGFWGQRYPAIGQSWRRAWSEVIPFFAFPDEVRRIVVIGRFRPQQRLDWRRPVAISRAAVHRAH